MLRVQTAFLMPFVFTLRIDVKQSIILFFAVRIHFFAVRRCYNRTAGHHTCTMTMLCVQTTFLMSFVFTLRIDLKQLILLFFAVRIHFFAVRRHFLLSVPTFLLSVAVFTFSPEVPYSVSPTVHTVANFCNVSLTWVIFEFSMGWLDLCKVPRSPTAFGRSLKRL